jgi:hypothetical protein
LIFEEKTQIGRHLEMNAIFPKNSKKINLQKLTKTAISKPEILFFVTFFINIALKF